MQLGEGNWAPEMFLSLCFKHSTCTWSLRDSLTAPRALIPIQISEKSKGARCLEIALLLRAWSGSCAIDNSVALLSPSINCPISPPALFQGDPGMGVLGHILLLCCSGSLSSPDQGCPRQTGRLWTQSSSSNFLGFSGSLWGDLTWVVSSAVKLWIWWPWFRNLDSASSHLRQ